MTTINVNNSIQPSFSYGDLMESTISNHIVMVIAYESEVQHPSVQINKDGQYFHGLVLRGNQRDPDDVPIYSTYRFQKENFKPFVGTITIKSS